MPDNEKVIDFNLNEIDIDDLVEFEEGDQKSVKFVRDFLGRFVSDGKDGLLPPEEGAKMVGKLKIRQIDALREQFTKDIEQATEDALNPTPEETSEPQS